MMYQKTHTAHPHTLMHTVKWFNVSQIVLGVTWCYKGKQIALLLCVWRKEKFHCWKSVLETMMIANNFTDIKLV